MSVRADILESVVATLVFVFLISLPIVWISIVVTVLQLRRNKYGLAFPASEFEQAVFSRRYASVELHTSTARLARGRKCIHVVVTRSELWLRAQFPASAFAMLLELDRRIDLASIVDVRRTGWWRVTVAFTQRSQRQVLDVTLWNAQEFCDILTNQLAKAKN